MLKIAMFSVALVGVLLFAPPTFGQPDPGEATSDFPEMDPEFPEYVAPTNGSVNSDINIIDPAAVDDRDEAISRVPTFEESGDGMFEETPQDAFLRLAEDYLFTSEIGSRNIGRIPVWPRGAVKIGPVELFPYLTGSISWTNNLYQQEDDEDSFYFTAGAGFTGENGFAGGRARLTYGVDFRQRWYSKDSESDFEIVTGLGLRYSFRDNVWVSAGVKWEHLIDPVSIEQSGDMRRNRIYPYIDIGWDDALGHKINIEIGLDYTLSSFSDRSQETGDYGEWDAHLKVSYPFFMDTTRVYLRYDYRWANRGSDRLNDMNGGHSLSGGIEGLIPLTNTGRLSGFLEVGYRTDTYDNADFYTVGADTLSTDTDDSKGVFTLGAGLNYYMGARTVWTLHVLRDLQHSTRGNYQVTDRVDLTVQRVLMRELVGRLATYWEHSDPSSGRSVGGHSITRVGLGAGFSWLVLENLDVFLDGELSRRSTAHDEFEHTYFTATLGVNFYFN